MQWLINIVSDPIVLTLRAIDLLAVLIVVYLILALTVDRRTLLMVRGFIVILFIDIISSRSGLQLLTFVLDKLLIGASVSMAVLLQTELRRFLEQLGRGNLVGLVKPSRRSPIKADSVIEKLLEAVLELSQNRTGALILIETGEPIEEHEFSVSGVSLNATLSKELLQTIFQTSTLLHDGAVWVREERILAAGVIFPISDRYASREIGTRHRAAMGITERVSNCFCIVVSEETGSIAIADQGSLDRPITSSKLREVLEVKLATKRPVTIAGKTGFNDLRKMLGWQSIFNQKSSRKK
ncbi:TIGR00159 family protein [Synechococcus sp. PCC 7502]|uniref:diadenylate cyclase CdaA n=1 Tax=Synechococcus sp. PCC 7502 TaxID=1173263 RepID=UPI00029F9841|nr:diadenylate cyclase CdaA [Synechococcus sp. PCC 7502]AFY73949.1 TIGR00159 family protein [Synechococcus sp. PCC 7502]